MANFDYDAPAEVYMTNSWSTKNKPVTYRRFDRSADAIRFAIEEEVGDERFEFEEIRERYDSGQYPLPRRLLDR
jgi:hypothetical protein